MCNVLVIVCLALFKRLKTTILEHVTFSNICGKIRTFERMTRTEKAHPSALTTYKLQLRMSGFQLCVKMTVSQHFAFAFYAVKFSRERTLRNCFAANIAQGTAGSSNSALALDTVTKSHISIFPSLSHTSLLTLTFLSRSDNRALGTRANE